MVTAALVMAHQSFASWLKCVFQVTFPLLSAMIVNVPEGEKEHSQVRCLNQGRSALFTCSHKYRKLTFLTPVNEKRVFIYRVRPKTQEDGEQLKVEKRDVQTSADNWKQEVSWLKGLLADKSSRSMRSRQTVARVESLTLTLTFNTIRWALWGGGQV